MPFKGKISQDDFVILNINTPNARTSTFVKKTLLKLKSHLDPHPLIVEDFNTPASPMDMSSRQKQNRNAGANRYYNPNGPSSYLQNISQKHKRRHSLFNTTQNILQN